MHSYSHSMPQTDSRLDAETQSLHTLLRCYCREVAAPSGALRVSKTRCGSGNGPTSYVAHIKFPYTGARVLAKVDRESPVGIGHFGQLWWQEHAGAPRRTLCWADFVALLLRELALIYERPATAELPNLLRQSVDVMTVILTARPTLNLDLSHAANAYIASEQALAYGHPFHPTPKARTSLSTAALTEYSPELGTAFALHYFAVRRDFIVEDGLATPATAIVASEGPHHLLPDASWALVPTHPWQAAYLQQQASVQKALAADQLRYLGGYGPEFFPTASVRTLYSPDSSYFYKTSLSFRITNCLRRNAVPEMAGALAISRLMEQARGELAEHFPGFRPLCELAYLSVELPSDDANERRQVSEGFGVMLRATINPQADEVCLLTASLFGNDGRGRTLITQLWQASAVDLEQWFSCYVEQLLAPMLYLYFRFGLMFEPHLQNTVLGCRQGLPVAMYLRDYENGRLVAARVPEAWLHDVAPGVVDGLSDDDELAWTRLAYCLFGNQLTEAIRQLSYDRPSSESDLWRIVREACEAYLRRFPSASAEKHLGALLAGGAIPAKANLLTRFLGTSDSKALFVPIGNPWQPSSRPDRAVEKRSHNAEG